MLLMMAGAGMIGGVRKIESLIDENYRETEEQKICCHQSID